MNKYLEIQGMLEKYFDYFNERFFEDKLPKVVITIQSCGKQKNTKSWFTVDRIWKNEDKQMHEINISAEYLYLGTVDVVATLLHEIIHLDNHIKGVKDVGSNMKIHNKKFKQSAENVYLEVEHSKSVGFGITNPTKELEAMIKTQPFYEEFKIHRIVKEESHKEKAPSYTYFCPTCDVKFRSGKEHFQLMCMACEQDLEVEEN